LEAVKKVEKSKNSESKNSAKARKKIWERGCILTNIYIENIHTMLKEMSTISALWRWQKYF